MSDRQGPFRALGAQPAEEAAAREARHQGLIDLLGAYADDELPLETASQLDAHLLGCARCRRELDVHLALRQRLAAEPLLPAPPALLQRVTAAVQALPAPAVPARPAPPPAAPATPTRRAAAWLRRHALPVAAVLALAVALPLATLWRGAAGPATGGARPTSTIAVPGDVPLLRAVLDDYRRVTAGDLPGRARDLATVREAVPFGVEPLRDPRLRMLGAWTTSLGGEPAAVLAYRWGDRILLQYVVPEHLFFRSPAVRSAVAGSRLLAAVAGAQSVVGWPDAAAGSLLVGDASADQLAGVSDRPR